MPRVPIAEPREIGAQPLRFRVVARRVPTISHAAAERRDVVGDVGGAAEPVLFVIEPDDRHRGFRRDALHAAEHEVIEHEVADDEDGAAGEARGKILERAHVDRLRRARTPWARTPDAPAVRRDRRRRGASR